MRVVPLPEQEPRQAGGGAPITPMFQARNAHATEEAAFAGCRFSGLESPERLDELGVRVEGRGVASGLRGALVRRLMGRQVRGGLSKVRWEMLKSAG